MDPEHTSKKHKQYYKERVGSLFMLFFYLVCDIFSFFFLFIVSTYGGWLIHFRRLKENWGFIIICFYVVVISFLFFLFFLLTGMVHGVSLWRRSLIV
ncbi:hypothetical protein BDZ91DRAFT_712100 [Kalaharituber pfeilii]|nr:hypothetical protein BDZ91DRAFT_712100 [Kalaharituber pfeilii]